ncbi:unnamed protein product [Larinioides sclopetarius]|uniref:Uncharacterized protein n=1 Tax=Larinioides sclopetarius TaxID=280406 RepID=A0AAV2AVM4_9ARAC
MESRFCLPIKLLFIIPKPFALGKDAKTRRNVDYIENRDIYRPVRHIKANRRLVCTLFNLAPCPVIINLPTRYFKGFVLTSYHLTNLRPLIPKLWTAADL